jgi:hypothetical protein
MWFFIVACLLSFAGLATLIAAATWMFEPACCKDRH